MNTIVFKCSIIPGYHSKEQYMNLDIIIKHFISSDLVCFLFLINMLIAGVADYQSIVIYSLNNTLCKHLALMAQIFRHLRSIWDQNHLLCCSVLSFRCCIMCTTVWFCVLFIFVIGIIIFYWIISLSIPSLLFAYIFIHKPVIIWTKWIPLSPYVWSFNGKLQPNSVI